MSIFILYNSSSVTFVPPLATSSTGWSTVNRSLPDSQASCTSLSAATLAPPDGANAHSWGSHTLSFNFSGASIFLYGSVDESYTWSVSIDGDSTGALRSIAPSINQCPTNFYNRTDLSNDIHSLTLAINSADEVHPSQSLFTFAYASTNASISNGSSPPAVGFQSARHPSSDGNDRRVIAYIAVPLAALALILVCLGYMMRRRRQRQAHLSPPFSAAFPVKNSAVHHVHLEMGETIVPGANKPSRTSATLHSRNPSKHDLEP